MNKVLSIYNEWAFCEIVLPSVKNDDYSFLLNSTLFHLQKAEAVMLECVQGTWSFRRDNIVSIFRMDKQSTDLSLTINDSNRYEVVTSAGEKLTILVQDRDAPLQVYSKYIVQVGQDISIGLDVENQIRYHLPAGPDGKSFISHRHCVIRYDKRGAVLRDFSPNGTYINNIRVKGEKVLEYGDSIRVFGLHIIFLGAYIAFNSPPRMETDLSLATPEELELLSADKDEAGNSGKTMFFRSPRFVPKISVEKIAIDPPPDPKEQPKMPLFMQIGPAMTMALPMLMGSGMTIYATRMSGGANPIMMMTGLVTAIGSALIGSFWALMNMRFSKKALKEAEVKRLQKYGQYLIDKQNDIDEIYRHTSEAYRRRYPHPNELLAFDATSENLWNRNWNHKDILSYRLGVGDLPFPTEIEIAKTRFTLIDDELAEKPQLIRDRFSMMRNVPVSIDLKEKSMIGAIGKSGGWTQVVKSLIIQIAASNSYTDVKIALVFDSAKAPDPAAWEFVRWLPHIWSEDRMTRFFAANRNEASEVFYSLGQIMRVRSEDKQITPRPHYVLFVLNHELLEGELIEKYMGDSSGSMGLSTVICADQYEQLPNNCEFIIENNEGFTGAYSTIDEVQERVKIDLDTVDEKGLSDFAKRLANITISESDNEGEMPNSISFFEMFGISRPEELNSSERWRKAKTSETMKALIGVKQGKVPCYLDIHERYHGPHGLVAGTTGSGKSETIQTYILSLAINYSPDDVGFFLIDYKGGGMANLFTGLPHVIGSISNLSGNQVKRAMVSIKSENRRRQKVFSDYGVNNISAYMSLYKSGDAKEPIPHMLIIIDEFAELKREEPDFMRELVSVAQVGRSLGVHLILATQKPAGTVDDNIWSNSKFKLCLRVQDRQDSMDMLHRSDAAYLIQAGRGFLQVGNDELFDLFQSGYSGVTYDQELGDQDLVVAQILDNVGRVDLVGNYFRIQYQEKARKNWMTLLYESVVEAMGGVFRGHRVDETLIGSEDFLVAVYEGIQRRGSEYERSRYNDIRLQEFMRLFALLPEELGGDAAEAIMRMAKERGIRLPEARKQTQLEAVIQYLKQVAVENNYTHSINLWMPVLPDHILLTEIEGYHDFDLCKKHESSVWELSAVIGKGDDPENQSQMPIRIDFAANGHHAVCGTVTTGKSTLLQTTIYALVNQYSSAELNLYLLDFSMKLLSVFDGCKQVGGIMTDGEEDVEKISKFFTMLSAIMDERKRLLASTNFRDYVEYGGNTLPAIVIAIDNFAAFREKTNDQYEDKIRLVAKEGINYGIFLLVTAGGFGSAEIPIRLADNFRTTICLEMSDVYQYGDVMRVVKPPVYPEPNTKGRGLVYYGGKIVEFQTALACPGKNVFERNSNIRKRVEKINAVNTQKPAKRIPAIPEKAMWEEYAAQDDYKALIADNRRLPIGYDAVTAAYASIDLAKTLTYVVGGTKKSGKSTYMKALIQAAVDKSSEVCIIEVDSKEFEQIASKTGARYVTDSQGIYDYAKDVLLPAAGERADHKVECLSQHLDDNEFFEAMLSYKRHCVFIANLPKFLESLYDRESDAYDAVSVYETLVGDKGYHYNFYFFLELGDNEIADVSGYGFMQSFRDNGTGIRFGGKYLNQKFLPYANIPYKLQSAPLKPGTGVLACDDESVSVEQVVVPYYKG